MAARAALFVDLRARHEVAELLVRQQHPTVGYRREPNLRCTSLKGEPSVAQLIGDHQAKLVASTAIERIARCVATICGQPTLDGPGIYLPGLPNVSG